MNPLKKKRTLYLKQKVFSVFLSLAVVAGVFSATFGVFAQQAPELTLAPVSPHFFSNFQNLDRGMISQTTAEGHGLGLIPSPLDLSHLEGQVLPKKDPLLDLPRAYDLRTQGKLTPVRDQGACGTCWAFATYGSLESNLLPLESHDFSENNLKNTHGFDWDPCEGGNANISTAYLARWSGPVSEADDPYYVYSGISPPGLQPKKHLQEVLIIPDRAHFSDNENIKQAVMTYGAFYTTMYWSVSHYHPTFKTYHYNGSEFPNHAVAIVGWDDDFDRNKFSIAPPGDGAFIVRNSWGNSWGDSGYFYISYYDSKIGKDNYVFNHAEGPANYKHIYQYDPLGWTSSTGFGTDTAFFANIFTAIADDYLSAVSFYTASLNSSYEIYIYKNVASNPVTGPLSGSKTGVISFPGYHTVLLDAPISLTSGQNFSVVIKLTTPGYNYPIPMEIPYSGYCSQAISNAGESYISSNGSSWSDITNHFPNTNVCLKAFTKVIAPEWVSISGRTSSAPTLAWNPVADKLQMVVRGSDNSLWTSTFNSSGVFNNDWTSIPGQTPSTPALAWNPIANELQMVVRAADNSLWTSTFNSSGAFNNDWTSIPGQTPSTPALAWNSVADKLQMVVRGSDNSLWTSTFNSSGAFNNDWTSIPGQTPSTPALAWNPVANELQMVVRAADNSLWASTFNSSGAFNNDWTWIPGSTPSTPFLAWDGLTSEIAMIVRGSDDSIWFSTFHSSGVFNNDWVAISGRTPSSPAMAYLPSIGYLGIVVRGSDNSIWRMLY